MSVDTCDAEEAVDVADVDESNLLVNSGGSLMLQNCSTPQQGKNFNVIADISVRLYINGSIFVSATDTPFAERLDDTSFEGDILTNNGKGTIKCIFVILC